MEQQMHKEVPRIVWMMWLQGLEKAPKVVQLCYESWVNRNPNWEVRMLDAHSFSQYVDIEAIVGKDRKDLSRPHLADIVRINLIADHGGVWADATCYCNRPLDEWIHEYTRSGFFAFLGHRKDTPMSNWFMSSQKNCYLTQRMRDRVSSFWQSNSFPETINGKTYRILKLLFNWSERSTGLWFSYFTRRILKVRPYFWFHYMFGQLCRKDPKFKKIWESTPKLDANEPHKLQRIGLIKPIDQDIVRQIELSEAYLYKLNWKLHKLSSKYDGNTYPKGSVIDYILNKSSNFKAQ